MGGKRAQVAIYVLAGVILLILVSLAIYATRVKRVEVQAESTPACDVADDPALAAELGRAQQRIDECLGVVAGETIADLQDQATPIVDRSTLEQALADEIGLRFSDCYFQFNTVDKVRITDDEPPRVQATLGDDKLLVVAMLTSALSADPACRLTEHRAEVPTRIGPLFDSLSSPASPSGAGAALPDASGLYGPDCSLNPAAFTDDGWYTDVVEESDGSLTAYFYDYRDWDGMEDPQPVAVEMAPCPGGEGK